MKRHHPILLLLTLTGTGLTTPASAGPTPNGQWKVSPGDTLFGIARQLAPGDRDRQRSLRRWILEHNTTVFGGDPNHLPLGAVLRLPPDLGATRSAAPTPPRPVAKRPVAAKPEAPATASQPARPAPAAVTAKPSPTPGWQTAPAALHKPTEPPPIGRIVIAAGDAEVVAADGSPRTSREIHEGDTVTTGPQSALQLRFSDGALMTLRPNSRLRIARYRFDRNRPEADATTLELIKGGLRTLTGVIGKRSRDRYQVQTTVATIGIRGTHYGLRLCGPGDCPGHEPGLYGAVADGAIVVRNRQGEFRFGNDEYFHLKAADARPRGLIRPPGVIFDADRGLRRAKARLRREADRHRKAGLIRQIARRGHPEALAIARLLPLARPGVVRADQSQANNLSMKRAPYGAVTVAAFNDLSNGVGSAGGAIRDNGTPDQIILLGRQGPVENIPVMVRMTDPVTGDVYGFAAGQAELRDIGGHPMGVNWGRWNGPFVVAENGTPAPHAGSFHYAYSPNIATLNQLSQLTATFNYATVGGTPATDHAGNVGAVGDANLSVDFSTQTITLYNVTATVNGKTYYGEIPVGLNISVPEAVVQGIPLTENTTPTCISGPCTGFASISFVNDYANGRPAAGVINGYSINEPDGSAGVSGVLFLTRP